MKPQRSQDLFGGGWKPLDDYRDVIASLWIKKQSNPKRININGNQ
ncbi:MAG: hypothetical protein ACO2O0_01430 [Desulfurococcales archaeon]